jgi:hypothetical protein
MKIMFDRLREWFIPVEGADDLFCSYESTLGDSEGDERDFFNYIEDRMLGLSDLITGVPKIKRMSEI